VTLSAHRWPKQVPTLTPEQQAIREDFMRYWHEVLPRRYSFLERFNHGYPAARRADWPHQPIATLEIGAGYGEHIAYEDLSFQHYTALELRDTMAERITARFPSVSVIVGDVQARIPAAEASFDRVVAVHVLEHLPNLPAALAEVRRVMKPNGRFSIVLPCEGGALYELARTISSRRLFEKRYRTSYDWFIRSEHVNTFDEIVVELRQAFHVTDMHYWPFRLPHVHANVVVGVTCRHRDT
jgi:SAM-dependent methyltransferase